MRLFPILLITLFTSIRSAAQAPDVRFTLHFVEPDRIAVDMRMRPLESDSTVFHYGEPRFGGQPDIFTGVEHLSVELPATMVVHAAERSVMVRYSGKKEFTVHYEVRDTHTSVMGVRGESFRPLISADYFFSHGINIFLVPALRDAAKKARLSLEWSRPPAFPIFYCYAPEHRKGKLTAPFADEFLFSPITGATNMTVDTFKVGKVTDYIVLRNYPGNPMTRDAVGAYFRTYYEAINGYWNDEGERPFSLVLHPFLEANNNISGVAYNTGFVGRYKRDTTFNRDQVFVLSHEIGHHWLGQGITIGMNDQWFGEGFNDYVSFCILASTKQVTAEEFTAKMNVAFQKLYSSPVRNTPNDSVFVNYWKMGDYNRLPYWRGTIFAFWLDNRIRLASGNGMCLRDLLLALMPLRKTEDGEQRITREDFQRTAAVFVPDPEIRAAFDRYIMKGETIAFTPAMLMPFFAVNEVQGIPKLIITDPGAMERNFPGTAPKRP